MTSFYIVLDDYFVNMICLTQHKFVEKLYSALSLTDSIGCYLYYRWQYFARKVSSDFDPNRNFNYSIKHLAALILLDNFDKYFLLMFFYMYLSIPLCYIFLVVIFLTYVLNDISVLMICSSSTFYTSALVILFTIINVNYISRVLPLLQIT